MIRMLEVSADTELDTDLAERAAEYDAVKVGDEVLYVLDFGDGLPRFSTMPKGAFDFVVAPGGVRHVAEWRP